MLRSTELSTKMVSRTSKDGDQILTAVFPTASSERKIESGLSSILTEPLSKLRFCNLMDFTRHQDPKSNFPGNSMLEQFLNSPLKLRTDHRTVYISLITSQLIQILLDRTEEFTNCIIQRQRTKSFDYIAFVLLPSIFCFFISNEFLWMSIRFYNIFLSP